MEDASTGNYYGIGVGSSYGQLGLEENQFDFPLKNLALQSQDMYYACLIAREAIKRNSKIEVVIIGCGYYYFYSDLSKTKNNLELRRVYDVYQPIFGDVHNAKEITETAVEKNSLWHIESILSFFAKYFFYDSNRYYFNEFRTRDSLKMNLWNDRNKSWDSITIEERAAAGRYRAECHNKALIGRESTFAENISIFDSFLRLCHEKNIKVYMCVFPGTKEYMRYLNESFRKNFFSAMECYKKRGLEVRVIDLNEVIEFETSDFNDTDHLNDRGALKATRIINSIITS